MNPLEKCSALDCMLIGAIVVLLLCLLFKREKFDTSLATRSQVGDATNLDTSSGMAGSSGSFEGDIYKCNEPILTVQPDAAFSWVDSQDHMAIASLAHLHPDAIQSGAEHYTSSERTLDLGERMCGVPHNERMCGVPHGEKMCGYEHISGTRSMVEPFDPSNTYEVNNSSINLRENMARDSESMRVTREKLARDSESMRSREGMVAEPTQVRYLSDSALSATMSGLNIGSPVNM